MISYIIWTFDPALFTLPFTDHTPRWYGVLFALGVILAQQLGFWIFKKEGKPIKDAERLTTYIVVATIIGARLGHCLFYDPVYYLSNPLSILKIWEGGLASHGGAIGILIAIYLFSRKYKYQYLWLLDRMVIIVALTGAMIRTGNLTNSEMEGTLTGSNVGIVYARHTYDYLSGIHEKVKDVRFVKGGQFVSEKNGEVPITAVIEFERGYKLTSNDKSRMESLKNDMLRYVEIREHIDFGEGALKIKTYEEDGISYVEIYMLGRVRHAAQMYEAIYCILLVIVLFRLWYKKKEVLPRGFNFALFMIILWAARFVDEFFKMNQEAFEDKLLFNMGQILSLPLAIAGIAMMIWIYTGNKKMSEE
ncbi:MAG: prolipoprotein diacylglyceryl transferase [Ekhidna sp.]|nr:prolipoprotein diacylglyceryl transferase [Ekhidna sp.]MBC6411231.1 prolipoprotein diacylglyceryl transferase [Ekhidna sp.]MBC6426402.1 prolipoprotein diacylglyceryl transferase [Ekhidna sp.]